MRSNINEIECRQVDDLLKLNGQEPVLESASLCAILQFLIEQTDEQEVRYCLDSVTYKGEENEEASD